MKRVSALPRKHFLAMKKTLVTKGISVILIAPSGNLVLSITDISSSKIHRLCGSSEKSAELTSRK